MKALVFHRPGKVSVDSVPDPIIHAPTDAIIRVTSTAICGSDLHIYNGFIPQKRPFVLGHEFMGVVEEVGRGVSNLKRGDRVIVPFPIACGACFFCNHDLPGHCETTNPEKYGPEGGLFDQKGGGMFGYTDLYGGYDGGQAQFARVPHADVGPRKITSDLSDEEILFLTDIFPTGYTAIDWAGIKGGETVAVFGCGPVGLMAMKSAWLRGAGQVIGVDILDYRLLTAKRTANAYTINSKECDALEVIRGLTQGRGADVCVDAVGMEADRTLLEKLGNIVHMQAGSINAFKAAASAVRRGGTLSVVGVYGMPYDNFPLGQLFDKGLRIKFGQAPVHKYIDDLIPLVEDGKIKLNDIISHRLALDDAPEGYRLFDKKEDGCVKVVLKP